MLGQKRRMIEMSGPLHVVVQDRRGYTTRDDEEGIEEFWPTRKQARLTHPIARR